jgi:hypothetical protein
VEESMQKKSCLLPRCSVCRLPMDTLARVHEDRLRSHLTLGQITGWLRQAGHNVTDSSLRRHLGRHVPDLDYWQISAAASPPRADCESVATAFDHLVGKELDAPAALEAGAMVLVEIMGTLVREYRATAGRRLQGGDRVVGQFMKMQNALVRSVKELEGGRAQRVEFRRTIPQIVDRITSEAVRSIASLMRENGKKVRDDFFEVANERMTVDEFWSRLSSAENQWATEVGKRMRAVTAQVLQSEEAKVEG